ncbi:hypothetical protein DENIT_80329 [Pseudomonas veronii]|nr:hypothetical protein DENIT_80329 [Pseudomonas veronii]
MSKYSLYEIFTSHPRQFAGFISLQRLYLKHRQLQDCGTRSVINGVAGSDRAPFAPSRLPPTPASLGEGRTPLHSFSQLKPPMGPETTWQTRTP